MVKDFNIESESEAKTTCEGKPFFLITKTKNFEQCKKTPFFQMITRDSIANSDVSKPNELMSVMSSTNIYVCGELNEFTVRKISHKLKAVWLVSQPRKSLRGLRNFWVCAQSCQC